MKDLYRKIGVVGPISTEEQVRSAIFSADLTAQDKTDAIEVLLNPARRAKYDKAWHELKNIAQLRANLGVADASCWTAPDFHAWPKNVSELEILTQSTESQPRSKFARYANYILGLVSIAIFGAMVVKSLDSQPAKSLAGDTIGPTPEFSAAPKADDNQQTLSKASVSSEPASTFDAPPVDPPRSGVVEAGRDDRIAPFEIVTSGTGFYYIKLVEPSTGITALAIFLRGSERISVKAPLGRYELRYASGDTWYGNEYLFGQNTLYSKADQLFDFETTANGIRGYTVELFLQSNGNLRTRGISADEF